MKKNKLISRPVFISNGRGGYMMIRWYIFFQCFKLHKFIGDDLDCMHDHPWGFISVMLKGSYLEETDKGIKKITAPGIIYRPAKHKHRILYDGNTCWTFVITFKRIRDWGFWTKTGWVQWQQYIRNGKKC